MVFISLKKITDPKLLNGVECSTTVTSVLVLMNVPCVVVKESAMLLINQYYCFFSIMAIVTFSNIILLLSLCPGTHGNRGSDE